MRLLPFENENLMEAIVEVGMLASDFRFVKRRGKLNVIYKENTTAFRFFRNETTILNAERKWEKRIWYTIYTDRAPEIKANWQQVLDEFDKWLHSL